MRLRRRRHPARRIDDALLNTVWELGDSMMSVGARGSYEAATGYLVCATVLEVLALRRELGPGAFSALTPDEFLDWRTATVQLAEDIARRDSA